MIPLAEPQLEALRGLRVAYPEAKIAIIGAAALGFHLDMQWRKTADLDLVIAVAVAEVDRSRLPGWDNDTHREQRWIAPSGAVVDIVPAPPDALAKREMEWPRSGHKMNLGGIERALAAPVTLTESDLRIAVPSVAVIALLKMAAFVDRPWTRERDLIDLGHILNNYPPDTDDRLFSDEAMELGLDVPRAQAFFLGRELKDACSSADEEIVEQFLELVSEDVHSARFVRASPWRYDEDALQRRIDSLRAGFLKSTASGNEEHGAESRRMGAGK